ncbi:hypothetical protein V500_05911 [Pseudogymnoascus sp. VKM F-4518 (FW-2643)]|nr:hypothetical protein V500_05911 [Pseudogymnoascus sp. VKM F-4518 (FW-2643)]
MDWGPTQDEEAESIEAASDIGANGDSGPVERQRDYRDVFITNIDDEGKLKLQSSSLAPQAAPPPPHKSNLPSLPLK